MAGCLWLTGCGDGSESAQSTFQLRGDPINPTTPATSAVAMAASSTTAATNTTAASSLPDPALPSPDPSLVPPNPQTSLPQKLASIQNAPMDEDGFKTIGFEQLSAYEFQVSDELMNPSTNAPVDLTARTEAQIPREIKALNETAVALKGFMLPLKVEGGLVTELLIMKDQSMCCFGTVPKINEWVSVKMVEKGVKPIMDQPITLFGKLHVGEMRENGYLVGIYSMAGEKMAGPLDY